MNDSANADSLTIRDARILTLGGDRPRRGRAMSDLGIVDRGDVHIRGGRIAGIFRSGEAPDCADIIDAHGRVLMPAFVDCHTHACWAGDRLDEWDMKRRGTAYLDILRAGGGIMSTVRAVREATEDLLTQDLVGKIHSMQREGTLCLEIKSGYGLSTKDELKMLRAIRAASQQMCIPISLTACIGHAIDPDVPRERFVANCIHETLDAVHEMFPDACVDAYCEEGAWTLEECISLFSHAIAFGHRVRVHTDQFHSLGMVEWAIEQAASSPSEPGVLSVDHLEASKPDLLGRVAGSGLAAVLLPCSGFHTDDRYANGRALIDAGGIVALATNYNPGSSPTASMPMAIALAVRKCGLSPAEAIAAATANGAWLLDQPERGSIEIGKIADLILLRHKDERMLAYEFGGNPVDLVVKRGRVLHRFA